MKKVSLFLVFTLGMIVSLQAQEQNKSREKSKAEQKISELISKKQAVRDREKYKLKTRVKAIEDRLKAGEITPEQANALKKEAAIKRAHNIEDKLDLIDLNISLIERNQDSTDNTMAYINVGNLLTRKKVPIDSVPALTHGSWGILLGYGSLASKTGKSEVLGGGFTFGTYVHLNTVLSRENPRWHLDYGVDMEASFLSVKGNNILVDQQDKTIVQKFPHALEKSRFSVLNIIFPVHLEYGKSPIKYNEERAYYDSRQWRVGLGGFAGFKAYSTLDYEYDLNGKFDKVSHHRSYNTDNFLYGISVYLRYHGIRVYGRYYLNELFKSAELNGHIIVAGVALGL